VKLPLLTWNENSPLSGFGAIDLIVGLAMMLLVILVSLVTVFRVIVSRRMISKVNQSDSDDSRPTVEFVSHRSSNDSPPSRFLSIL
jgi:hypothetical protein